MTMEDDVIIELKRLMTEAVDGHRFDVILEHMHEIFDVLADDMGLGAAERICICLAKAYQLAVQQNDHQMIEALNRMLEPIMPDQNRKD